VRICRACVWTLAITAALTARAGAQIGGKPVNGGNPTPGTEQPAPPDLANRVTLTGCLGLASKSGNLTVSSGAIDGNAVLDSRFELTGAERQSNVPADTGGSPAAAAASSRTYRLAAIESQLSPFVGTKVEISGEILPRPDQSPQAAAPTLQVQFVQKLATSCRTPSA
jgi:hypothetical protein